MGWIFWIWYGIGAVLLLTIGVPQVLDFSNGLFLVFYALYAMSLVRRSQPQYSMSDWSVSNRDSITLPRLLTAAALMWLGGMALEWIGVHTGWPFGEYEYSSILGSLVFGVPWTLGFAWIAVVSSGILLASGSQRADSMRARLLRALQVGVWIIILDLVLDPVADARGFWSWGSDSGFYGVPWSNFIAWFIVGGMLSLTIPIIRLSPSVARQAVFLYQGILLMFGLLAWQQGLIGSVIAGVIGIVLAEGSYRYDRRQQVSRI
ncbi:carotenoid biosynthesis protein [Paenibacillus wenxiniae]|uniref:Carotenoid biosynthesis protein n=1 Tax=Paenibacillus wenxiniae TaxID=1636843 RepID=A0ABW4RM88_9BACL